MRRSLLRCRGPELAHRDVSLRGIDSVAIGGIADMPEALRAARCHAIDPLPPSAIQSSCVAVFLFDQLVRAQQDRCRHIEAKRLGGRHIEHGLVFHRQLHRQIGRLLALKDAVDVGGGAASMAYLVRPI